MNNVILNVFSEEIAIIFIYFNFFKKELCWSTIYTLNLGLEWRHSDIWMYYIFTV